MVPAYFKCAVLLAASYLFYGSQNIWYLVFLALATLLSYGSALWMMHIQNNYKKAVFVLSLVMNLSALGYFKYADFLSGGRISSLLLPVGISFYLFMSCGYLADVYHGRIIAEKNLLKYALFVSFFPTILSGPIERAGNMLPQFSTDSFQQIRFDASRIRDGESCRRCLSRLVPSFAVMVHPSVVVSLGNPYYGNSIHYKGSASKSLSQPVLPFGALFGMIWGKFTKRERIP